MTEYTTRRIVPKGHRQRVKPEPQVLRPFFLHLSLLSFFFHAFSFVSQQGSSRGSRRPEVRVVGHCDALL